MKAKTCICNAEYFHDGKNCGLTKKAHGELEPHEAIAEEKAAAEDEEETETAKPKTGTGRGRR